MKLLVSYCWAGNIRELKNVISSAVVLAKGEILMPSDLDFPSQGYGKAMGTPPDWPGDREVR
jgi:DNA-binding NtrC family response regulator